MDEVVIGVDAGGSKTIAASSHAPDAISASGPANPTTIGGERACLAILEAVRAASAGRAVGALVVGAAGAGRAAVAEELRDRLRAAGVARGPIAVVDDASIALRAGVSDGAAIVLVAGTGSVAAAERDGTWWRVGGGGYVLGDEGSAFAIGLAAAKLALRAFDGRTRADETVDLVRRALVAGDRDALLAATYATPFEPARLAALAPSVIAFAGKGNRAATKIVQGAAGDLADLVRAVAEAAGLRDAAPAVVLAGGLFRENSLLTFLVETRIAGDVPGARIVRNVDPVLGALRLAHALRERGTLSVPT